MKAAINAADQITGQQLREAQDGLIRWLRSKRFPRYWIELHAPDAIAQANVDFAMRRAAGRKDDTVSLLVVIAYRKALKILRAQRLRPTTSMETVFHLADESMPTPEEKTLEQDLQKRVAKAMSHLPKRERMMMVLVYFENTSIREAGRRVGWGKSAADSHHRAALEKLEAFLDPNLLAP